MEAEYDGLLIGGQRLEPSVGVLGHPGECLVGGDEYGDPGPALVVLELLRDPGRLEHGRGDEEVVGVEEHLGDVERGRAGGRGSVLGCGEVRG